MTHNLKKALLCLSKTAIDEPVFVLRAQDKLAPDLIDSWARRIEAIRGRSKKTIEALELAQDMKDWQRTHPDKVKIPD